MEKTSVLVGLDGEFGLQNSISAQAIELGLRTSIAQINESGGVLGGRPIALVTRENRSILARGVRNSAEFAAMPNLVAVFGGRFSPLITAQVPALNAAMPPYLAVRSADDLIIDNGAPPNDLFRLSLRDALEKVRDHRGLIKLYKPPFTAARHAALGPAESLMARYNRQSVLLPAQK